MDDTNQSWWDADDDEVGDVIQAYMNRLRHEQSERLYDFQVYKAIYGNDSSMVMSWEDSEYGNNSSGLKLNITKNMVDSAVSRIGKSVPALRVVPNDAQWSFKRRATRLNKYLNARMRSSDVQVQAPLAFRDAAIYGTGFLKAVEIDGKVYVERVIPFDIFVDPVEAQNGTGKVSHMHQCSRASKDQLIADFVEDGYVTEQEILDAPDATRYEWENRYDIYGKLNGLVNVVESWKLPTTPGGDDGRHVISIPGAVLLDEEWEVKRFPISHIHWNAPDMGFWGTGLVEDMADLQWEINQTMLGMQRNMWFGSMLKVFVNRNADIQTSHITNDIAIIEHNGEAPVISAPAAVNQSTVGYLNLLIKQAYEQHGISQMMASSQKPPGLTSGVSLMEHYDQQSERFQTISRQYQYMFVNLAEMIIDCQKAISDMDEDRTQISWVDKDVVKKIDWDDVSFDKNDYELQLEATNFLPETRGGKLEIVEALAKNGVISGKWIPSLFEEPDMKRFNALNNASFHYVEFVIETLSDDEAEFINPETIMDHALAFELITAAYQEALVDEAPDEVIQRFDKYIGLLKAMMDKMMAEQMAQAQAAQMPQQPAALPAGAPPTALEGNALPGTEQ